MRQTSLHALWAKKRIRSAWEVTVRRLLAKSKKLPKTTVEVLRNFSPKELQKYAKKARISVQQARRDRNRSRPNPKIRSEAVATWKRWCDREFCRDHTYANLRMILFSKFKTLVSVQTLSVWCKHVEKPCAWDLSPEAGIRS